MHNTSMDNEWFKQKFREAKAANRRQSDLGALLGRDRTQGTRLQAYVENDRPWAELSLGEVCALAAHLQVEVIDVLEKLGVPLINGFEISGAESGLPQGQSVSEGGMKKISIELLHVFESLSDADKNQVVALALGLSRGREEAARPQPQRA